MSIPKAIVLILTNLIVFAFIGLLCLSFFGIKAYTISSGSMSPTIDTGAVVLVDTNKGIDDIAPGDVISFNATRNLVTTHRVEQITASGIITKGDANDTVDPTTVSPTSLIGKCLIQIPFLGFFFLDSRINIILLLAIVVLVAISLKRSFQNHDRIDAREGLPAGQTQ